MIPFLLSKASFIIYLFILAIEKGAKSPPNRENYRGILHSSSYPSQSQHKEEEYHALAEFMAQIIRVSATQLHSQ